MCLLKNQSIQYIPVTSFTKRSGLVVKALQIEKLNNSLKFLILLLWILDINHNAISIISSITYPLHTHPSITYYSNNNTTHYNVPHVYEWSKNKHISTLNAF